jgi:methionyl-tRNA synthetase
MIGVFRKTISMSVFSSPVVYARGFRRSRSFSSKMIKYITIPIFYVNGAPHIGHLYTALLGDAMSRFYRQLLGVECRFIGGTDEHGLKVQEACFRSTGTNDYQSYCDGISRKFSNLFETFDIKVDEFLRTTAPAHKEHVSKMWNNLEQNKFVYRGLHEGYYSKVDEAFFPLNQLRKDDDGNMRVITSGSLVQWFSEENYMFRLSIFQKPLLDWLIQNPDAITPEGQYKQVVAFLQEEKLEDLSVSRLRAKAPWGIQVPSDPNHSIYVWLDALNIYLTAVMNLPAQNSAVSPINAAQLPCPAVWPPDLQIIGKDIIRFHAVYWPAFLMAAGLPLPKRIVSHAHWSSGDSDIIALFNFYYEQDGGRPEDV